MDASNNSIAILGAAIGAGGSMFLSFLRTLPMSDKNPSARPQTTGSMFPWYCLITAFVAVEMLILTGTIDWIVKYVR